MRELAKNATVIGTKYKTYMGRIQKVQLVGQTAKFWLYIDVDYKGTPSAYVTRAMKGTWDGNLFDSFEAGKEFLINELRLKILGMNQQIELMQNEAVKIDAMREVS